MAEGPSRSDPVQIPGLRPPARAGWTVTETIAAAATALWLILVLLVPRLSSIFDDTADPLRPIIVAVAVLMPVALIWIAARASRTARDSADEIRRLHFALSSLRQSVLADRQARAIGAGPPGRPDNPATPAASLPASNHSSHPPSPAQRPAEDQPSLSLGGEAEHDAPALSSLDLIRALHFPNDQRDEDGFAALRRAVSDRQTRHLIQASQDVLTLLSQDGIYMDDLASDRSRPELWRRFARGERGGVVQGLGGALDKEVVASATFRLREDAVFRDAVHHFLRLFDRRLSAFEPVATDEDLMLLAETRTARAFMLLGRATGIFD